MNEIHHVELNSLKPVVYAIWMRNMIDCSFENVTKLDP